MCYLLDFILYWDNMSLLSSPVASTLQRFHVFLAHLEKKKRTSEMLWRRSGDLHPRLDTILCISLVLYFLCPLPWMRHSSLLFLSAHFGATILAVRPVTVTLSQFYAHFLSVTRFISSTLPLPFSASPDTLSTLLCNQTHCLMPFSNYFSRFFRSTGH